MVDGSYYLGTTFVHIEVHKRRALPVIHSDRKSQQTAQKEENTNLRQQLFRGATLQVEFPLEREYSHMWESYKRESELDWIDPCSISRFSGILLRNTIY